MNQTDLAAIPSNTGEILCKWLAVTINPSDLNQIEGTYPSRPSLLPAYGGNEGVAEVVQLSQSIPSSKFKIGDWVIPRRGCLGTWRNYGWYKETDLLPIQTTALPIEIAACLTVNPTTAWRLLKDFYNFSAEPKGWIIQNASTSMVGQCLVQLCRYWNIPNIAVIRAREGDGQLGSDEVIKKQLLDLGATVVVREDEVKEAVTQQPVLAFNAVGGSSATEMLQVLAPNSTMVTYGAMSRKPFVIPAKIQIFQNVHLCGFWMTRWYKEHGDEERIEMLSQLILLLQNGELKLRVKRVPFEVNSIHEVEGSKTGGQLREKLIMYPN